MEITKPLKRALSGLWSRAAQSLMPTNWKEANELHYWRRRKNTEGTLSNAHYKDFYTTHFGLAESFYENKMILDIGCGPRGSLEWADMASRRIGLDPLAAEYRKLGADSHKMEYISSPAETIPLEDGTCDVVFSFNSLDHVESVERVAAEIKRVVRVGGLFLLLVEINHPPTSCEPHELNPGELLRMLEPEFICGELRVYEPVAPGIYESLQANVKRDDPFSSEKGFMAASFSRVAC